MTHFNAQSPKLLALEGFGVLTSIATRWNQTTYRARIDPLL